jgi:hypothetical protein
VARDAVLEPEHLPEQGLFGDPELGHVHAALRSANARRDRDEHHLGQLVTGVGRARVLHRAEANTKPTHPPSPTKERASESISGEPGNPICDSPDEQQVTRNTSGGDQS